MGERWGLGKAEELRVLGVWLWGHGARACHPSSGCVDPTVDRRLGVGTSWKTVILQVPSAAVMHRYSMAGQPLLSTFVATMFPVSPTWRTRSNSFSSPC